MLLALLAAHGLGLLCQRFGQPRLVGEMAAGIVLGPSVLGAVAPSLQVAIFTPQALGFMDAIAQLGVVLFMFVIGLELSLPTLRRSGPISVIVGHGTIAGPLLAGVLLAFALPAVFHPAGLSTGAFALFLGLALSVTALPVLARVLDECGLNNTRIGTIGLGSAAVCDVTAWLVLAVVVILARGGTLLSLARTVLLLVALAVLMAVVVRPLLARLARATDDGRLGPVALVLACLAMLVAAALAADAIGVHMILGALLAGIITPRSRTLHELSGWIKSTLSWLLLPLFFVMIGLRMVFNAASGSDELVFCVLVVVVAIVVKFAATGVSARAAGLNTRDSVDLSVMMSCRGVTELVMLNIGLSLGLLTGLLFSVLVVMAVLSTLISSLILKWRTKQVPPTGLEPTLKRF
ncbi:MAG: sodium:proton exchanger [Actinophytocola sp.]|uniref:cation:proton antiporter n=1 Tax=Actinophytocola sp. TaxID=1872138 RepID=UPI0013282ED8|nr:sodium:proton exchanger [Actinophytocola sp.]